MDEIKKLLQKRGELVDQMRGLLSKAEAENREMSAEEVEQYDKLDKEQERIGNKVKRLERQNELENELDQPTAEPIRLGLGSDPERPRASDGYRQAFMAVTRRGQSNVGPQVFNALQIGTDSEGGFIVPESFETRIVEAIQDINEWRQFCTVITTDSDRNIPIEDTLGSMEWIAEEGAYTDDDPAFGRVVLGAHKLGRIVRVSEELLQDAFFDLEGYLIRNFGKRFGIAEEAAYVNGDGNGKPRGMLLDAGVTVNAAANNAISDDDVLELYYGLKRPYRRMAVFAFNDTTLKAIRKLKDNDGQYLWAPGLRAGEPDNILSRPVISSEGIPSIAASTASGLFGDPSYYTVADRLGTVMQRLNELYAANGQIGFRGRRRTDGKVVLPEAFAKLVHPA